MTVDRLRRDLSYLVAAAAVLGASTAITAAYLVAGITRRLTRPKENPHAHIA